jgi:hypothetical protein
LILGSTGRKFWQAESYDHWVRDDTELERIAAYIENNPVKAGLVDSGDKYRWSSAGKSVETRLRPPEVGGDFAGDEERQ